MTDSNAPRRLAVLADTDPAAVLAAERAIDLSSTLLIVASKSGTTLEAPGQELRCRVREATLLATTLGYGPRYLHSTLSEPGRRAVRIHVGSDIDTGLDELLESVGGAATAAPSRT
jgi:glucose-6-phosphate isomerase